MLDRIPQILTPNALTVLERRYLIKDENDKCTETPQDLFSRVAEAVANAEYQYGHSDEFVHGIRARFLNMLTNLEFLPNSPTLMNAGRALGQLSACFVLPIKNDIRQIFRTIKNTALIHKSGGGTGFNFDKVKLNPVKNPNTSNGDYIPTFIFTMDHSDFNEFDNTEFSHIEKCTVYDDKHLRKMMMDLGNDNFLIIDDNMESIFDLEKLLEFPQYIVFSNVRPHKARVSTTGGEASGPVSFMKVWNEAVKYMMNDMNPITTIQMFNMCTEVVKQGGTRRGANMGIVNINNEYVEQFITCKKDNKDINNFNISVGIVPGFWDIYMDGGDYTLTDGRVVNSVKLMDMIIDNAWNNGEPGIIFLDKINEANMAPEEEIESTNPCGEQPLFPYESCNLGSINLVSCIRIIDGIPRIDRNALAGIIWKAVRFLDNVIDINKYPIPEIEETTKKYRKIGLGVMGWADALYILKIPYNSPQAVLLAEQIAQIIQEESHKVSMELGAERGAFPAIESTKYRGTTMRNLTTTTIAPTGTIGIIASVSSGIEPQFAIAFMRNAMDNDELYYVNPHFQNALLAETNIVKDGQIWNDMMKRVQEEGTIQHMSDLLIPASIKSVFVTTHDIGVEWHIRHQAAFQKYCDNAVSKTINMKNEATKGDVKQAYTQSYLRGCKGITIYRDGSRDEQVLNVGKKKEEPKPVIEETAHSCTSCSGSCGGCSSEMQEGRIVPTPRLRPEMTYGHTEKVKIGCGNLYVTVNTDEEGICEVFTNTGKTGGCPSQSEATARLVSMALRAGVRAEDIVDQLKGIRCPSTIRQQGLKVTSCPDAIAKAIEKCLVEHPEFTTEKMVISNVKMEIHDTVTTEISATEVSSNQIKYCQECGTKVEHEGGCVICRNCGWGKCG